jgi:hypothetical protein
MKPILRHISLLIFSGLIRPVCNSIRSENSSHTITNKAESAIEAQPTDLNDADYSFYDDIAELAFPVLKSLNKM